MEKVVERRVKVSSYPYARFRKRSETYAKKAKKIEMNVFLTLKSRNEVMKLEDSQEVVVTE